MSGYTGNLKEKNFIVRIVLGIAMITSLIVWAIIGFIIYIPMLLRIFAYYCTMVIISTFQKVDLLKIQARVEYVANIYPSKFKDIIDSYYIKEYEEYDSKIHFEPINFIKFIKTAWVDLSWGIVFWLSFSVFVLPLQGITLGNKFIFIILWLFSWSIIIILLNCFIQRVANR